MASSVSFATCTAARLNFSIVFGLISFLLGKQFE
jgi:hypothetical protein